MLQKPGSQLVFDRIIVDNIPTKYSDPKFDDWLGRSNELSVFVVVDRVSGSGQIFVQLEDAPEGQNHWEVSNGTDTGDGGGIAVSVPLSPAGLMINSADSEEFRGRAALGFRRIGVLIEFDASPASARVRIWVAARGGYRIFHRLLFSDRLEGTGVFYGHLESCTAIAGVDTLTISILAEEVVGIGNVVVQLEESPDGKTWIDVPNSRLERFLISGEMNTAVMFTDAVSGFPYSTPSGLIRFRLQLTSTSLAATVRLWATGRDVHPP